MFKVILLPLARNDIKVASDWYNGRQKGLGQRFARHVREAVAFIKQNPRTFEIRYDNVRTAVLNVFPFMIHYQLDEKKQLVIISAVFHTSQNPDIWKKRQIQ